MIYKGINSLIIIFEIAEKLKTVIETRAVRRGKKFILLPIYILGIRRIKITFILLREAFQKRVEINLLSRILSEIYTFFKTPRANYAAKKIIER